LCRYLHQFPAARSAFVFDLRRRILAPASPSNPLPSHPIVLFEMGRSVQAAKVFGAQAGHDLGAFPGHTASADPMFSGRVTQAKSRLQGSPTNKRGRRLSLRPLLTPAAPAEAATILN
jgi:hypothetical protein